MRRARVLIAFLGAHAGLGFGQIGDVFREPEKACELLKSDGLDGGEWEIRPYGFECASESLFPGRPAQPEAPQTDTSGNSFPPGSITYIASGDGMTRITRVKLIMSLEKHSDNAKLVAEFQRLSSVLLSYLGFSYPKDLSVAIRSKRNFRQGGLRGTITFDPGRRPYTTMVLAVRDPRVRVVAIPRAY